MIASGAAGCKRLLDRRQTIKKRHNRQPGTGRIRLQQQVGSWNRHNPHGSHRGHAMARRFGHEPIFCATHVEHRRMAAAERVRRVESQHGSEPRRQHGRRHSSDRLRDLPDKRVVGGCPQHVAPEQGGRHGQPKKERRREPREHPHTRCHDKTVAEHESSHWTAFGKRYGEGTGERFSDDHDRDVRQLRRDVVGQLVVPERLEWERYRS